MQRKMLRTACVIKDRRHKRVASNRRAVKEQRCHLCRTRAMLDRCCAGHERVVAQSKSEVLFPISPNNFIRYL
jgi:hypothetical protein